MANESDFLIFVVENNKVYNHLVTEYLKKQKFTNVKSIISGEECVKLIEDGEIPDIVIQDYSLDGMSGLDVLRKVKKISAKSEFIFLTSNENMEVAVNTIKFGAYDYIVKDKMALEKVVYKMRKITQMIRLERKNKQIKKLMNISLIVVALIIIFAFLFFVFDIFGVRVYT